MHTPAAERPSRRDDTDWYEIRLDGVLDPRWATCFEAMELSTGGGTTLLAGAVDQAALHGQLHRLRDVGLRLVSVVRVDAPPGGTRTPRHLTTTTTTTTTEGA